MDSFSEHLNKLVNSSQSSQQEKSLEENIPVLKKNICTKDEIIKKLVETQNTVLNTISAKSNNQHSNTLNQSSSSLPSKILYNTKSLPLPLTRTATCTYRTTLFFTSARNTASHSNAPPKIRAKYHNEKYICG